MVVLAEVLSDFQQQGKLIQLGTTISTIVIGRQDATGNVIERTKGGSSINILFKINTVFLFLRIVTVTCFSRLVPVDPLFFK